MKKLWLMLAASLLLTACEWENETMVENTDAGQAAKGQTAESMVANAMQRAEGSVAEAGAEAGSTLEGAAEQFAEKTGNAWEASKSGVKDAGAAVTAAGAALVAGAKNLGADAVEKTKEAGAAVAEKTGELVEGAKELGADAVDATQSAVSATGEKLSAAGEAVADKTDELVADGKAVVSGEADAATESATATTAVQAEGEVSGESTQVNMATYGTQAAAQPAMAVGGQAGGTDYASPQVTKVALSELVEQLEAALENLEKAAGDARDAAHQINRELWRQR